MTRRTHDLTYFSSIKTPHTLFYQKEIPSSYEPTTNQVLKTTLLAAKVLPKPATDYLKETN